jgi:DNA gyrase/topoisomerase IV subunit B
MVYECGQRHDEALSDMRGCGAERQNPRRFWSVSVSDNGRGILSAFTKEKAFRGADVMTQLHAAANSTAPYSVRRSAMASAWL